jgi:hypothetical protein
MTIGGKTIDRASISATLQIYKPLWASLNNKAVQGRLTTYCDRQK